MSLQQLCDNNVNVMQITCMDDLLGYYTNKVRGSSIKRLLHEYWSLNQWREDQLSPQQYARKQALFNTIQKRPIKKVRNYRNRLAVVVDDTINTEHMQRLIQNVRWLDYYLAFGKSLPGKGKCKESYWIYNLTEGALYSYLEEFLIHKLKSNDPYYLEAHEQWEKNEIWREIHTQEDSGKKKIDPYASLKKMVISNVLMTYREKHSWVISEGGLRKEYELHVTQKELPILLPITLEGRMAI